MEILIGRKLGTNSAAGRLSHGLTAAAAVAALFMASGAQAQKAKDTLRVAVPGPMSTVMTAMDPQPQSDLASHAVFDNLLCFDRKTLSFQPLLAQSWAQTGERTIEVKLRRDVKFHDGTPFTSEDAVFSLNWLRDPNNKLRFASEYFTWVDRVEKVDDFTFRIAMKEPTSLAFMRLAVSTPVVPAKLMATYADKMEFGRKTPVGTGPYKVLSYDATAGIALVKNDDYRHGGDCKPAAKIGRVQIVTIPDAQTQLAQLLTDGLDLFRGETKDQAEWMMANGHGKVTASQGVAYYFLAFDAVNRSGKAALSNLKVRQAIARAINREAVARSVLPGGDALRAIDAVCLPNHRGCDFSVKPPAFDLAAAKALLTEAGYPDGFDTEIMAVPGGGTMAEAVAGELRKIGIRAKVDKPSFAGYRQKQRDGQAQMILGTWTMGGLPDVYSTADYFFDGGARDYAHDTQLTQWARLAASMADDVKRNPVYRQFLDRNNEMLYVMPLTTSPSVFIHSKDLVVETGTIGNYDAEVYEMRWN